MSNSMNKVELKSIGGSNIDPYSTLQRAISGEGSLGNFIAKKEERDILEKDKAEAKEYRDDQIKYTRDRDTVNDKRVQDEYNYKLKERQDKTDFMNSIANPTRDALDTSAIDRLNELSAGKWSEANPISDSDAEKLNSLYSSQAVQPTLDQSNLRNYIGQQALKYGQSAADATATWGMFKEEKDKEMSKIQEILIKNELDSQRDYNKIKLEADAGKFKNKYNSNSNGKDGGSKNSDSAVGVMADINAIKVDEDWADIVFGGERQKLKDTMYRLATDPKNPVPEKYLLDVIKASIDDNNELSESLLAKAIQLVPKETPTGSNDEKKLPAYNNSNLQELIGAKGGSEKVDKAAIAEDMFAKQFGLTRASDSTANSSGGKINYTKPTDGKIDTYIPLSLPKEYENAYNSLIGKEGTDTKGKYVGFGQFQESTALPYLNKLGKTWKDFNEDPYLQKEVTAMHMVENGNMLKNSKLPVTDTNLYMLHNLGAPLALKTLRGEKLNSDDSYKILNQLSNKQIGVDIPRFAKTPENIEKGVVGQIDINRARNMISEGKLTPLEDIDASGLWMNKFGKKNDNIETLSKPPFDVNKKDTYEQAIVDRFQEINSKFKPGSNESKEAKNKAMEEIKDKFSSDSRIKNSFENVITNEEKNINSKNKYNYLTEEDKIKNFYKNERIKLNKNFDKDFQAGNLSPLDNTFRKLGISEKQKYLNDQENYKLKELYKKTENNTNITRFDEMQNDAHNYDKKEIEKNNILKLQEKEKNSIINGIKQNPNVIDAYNNAWKSEARKKGISGTSYRPFSIEEWISTLSEEQIDSLISIR